ncbi:MAG: LexA family transcriptional regulator [Clostridia bacterium]|nr:LexA family transcriptional regulator [Clostridia bacterium]
MNRICELRKQNKLTQKALAEKLQVDQSAVSYWECGRAFPDTQKQIMLADLFGVSIDYVLGRDVPKGIPPGSLPPAGEQLVFVQPPVAPPPAPAAPSRTIKVYSSLNAYQFSSGSGEVVQTLDIPEDWQGEYYGILMRGDSMAPRYLDGDVIIIRRQTVCENGQDAYVFIGQQEGTLKKVFLDFNRSVTLKPINQAYRTLYFSEREIAALPLVIAGVAVELRRKIV